MTTRKNRSRTLALTLALTACDEGSPVVESPSPSHSAPGSEAVVALGEVEPEPEPEDRSEPAAEPAAMAPSLREWLRSSVVTDEAFARWVHYTWTSDETAARMHQEHALFDDNVLPEGSTPYVQRLEHVASRKGMEGRLARVLLGHPDLRRRRYAWSSPWPTRLGLVRPYGEHLVRVQLRPRAFVGRFDPSGTPVWTFHDLDERPVPLARVMAHPGRVAAIYHVHRGESPHVREYVLCNEAMVESWSLDTEELAERRADDAARLRELATLSAEAIGPEYADALAFDVDRYRPTSDNLAAIADALVSSPAREPLVVRPRRRFRHAAAPGMVKVRQLPPRIEDFI